MTNCQQRGGKSFASVLAAIVAGGSIALASALLPGAAAESAAVAPQTPAHEEAEVNLLTNGDFTQYRFKDGTTWHRGNHGMSAAGLNNTGQFLELTGWECGTYTNVGAVHDLTQIVQKHRAPADPQVGCQAGVDLIEDVSLQTRPHGVTGHAVEVNGDAKMGYILQNVTVVPGDWYEFSFLYGYNEWPGHNTDLPNMVHGEVRAGTQVLAEANRVKYFTKKGTKAPFSNDPADLRNHPDWSKEVLKFQPPAGVTQVTVEMGNPGQTGLSDHTGIESIGHSGMEVSGASVVKTTPPVPEATPPAGSTLLTNGDFKDYVFAGGPTNWHHDNAGMSAAGVNNGGQFRELTGWECGTYTNVGTVRDKTQIVQKERKRTAAENCQAGVDLIEDVSLQTRPPGVSGHAVEVNGDAKMGYILQNVTVVPGETYEFSFLYGLTEWPGHDRNLPNVVHAEVRAGAQVLADVNRIKYFTKKGTKAPFTSDPNVLRNHPDWTKEVLMAPVPSSLTEQHREVLKFQAPPGATQVTVEMGNPGYAGLSDHTGVNSIGHSGMEVSGASVVQIVPVPTVTVSKDITPLVPKPGDEVTYTLTAKNNTDVPKTAVQIFDDLSDVVDDATWVDGQLTTVPSPPAAQWDEAGQEVSWQGDIAGNGTVKITYKLKVKPSGGNGKLVNKFTATNSKCVPPSSTLPECRHEIIIDNTATVEVSKSMSPAGVAKPGDELTYTLTAKNLTAVPKPGVHIVDDLSDVVDDATWLNDRLSTVPSAPAATWDAGSHKVSWQGTIGASATVVITYVVRVNEAGGSGKLVNTFTSTNSICAQPNNLPQCRHEVMIDRTPSVTVKKELSPLAPKPGEEITYTLTAHNDTAVPKTAMHIVDDLSDVVDDAAWLDRLSTDPALPPATWDAGSHKVSWQGTIGANATLVIKYVLKVNPSGGGGNGRLINKFTSSYSPCPPRNTKPECQHDVIIVRGADSADLVITKTGPSTVLPGTEFDYQLTVTNKGPSAAVNVKVTDQLAPGLTFARSADGCMADSSQLVTCTLPSLAAQAHKTWTITVKS